MLLYPHLSAGARLQLDREKPPEAILRPDGKVEHAEGKAKPARSRERLLEAVRSLERTRGRLGREDPITTVEAREALVAGRWSLVDRLEEGGRRYVLAVENRHQAGATGKLPAELESTALLAARGFSDKLIAAELGISARTVARRLTQARQLLGVDDRWQMAAALLGQLT
jgi:DNA-binding NarL/FixJ family response regulator